jgi:hypothetical protein
VEVILNYEWRFSQRKRLQTQEIIHRYCSPLQLHWKDINFESYGQSREEQQSKAFINFDTFRIQLQQKLNDIDTTLNKIQSPPKQILPPDIVLEKSQPNTPIASRRPSAHASMEQLTVPQQGVTPTIINNNQTMVLEEIARLRELVEEALVGQTNRNNSVPQVAPASIGSIAISRRSTTIIPARQQIHADTRASSPVHTESHLQPYSQEIGERVTDLQLAVNRLHQDVSAIRQVVERMSPLSASLILGRTAGLK